MSRSVSFLSPQVILWGILLLAAVVRLGYLTEYASEIPHYDQPMVDARIYDEWSKQIRDGDLVGRDRGVFYRAPLYPYFVGLFQSPTGSGPMPGLIIVQALLGLTLLWMTARWARELAGEWAGVAAAGLLLLYSPLLTAESKILSTTLGLCLQVGVLWLAAGTGVQAPLRRFFFLGVLLGAAVLVRPLWLLWLGALPLVLFGRETLKREALVRSALFLFGAILLISPVTVRNWVVADDFVLVSANGGMTFFQGNNVENRSGLLTIISRFQMFGSADRQEELERSVASELSGRELSPSASSRFWLGQGVEFITERPLDWLALEGRKLLRFVSSFEYGDNYSHALEAERIPLLRFLFLPFGALLGLAAFGWGCVNWRRPSARMAALGVLTGLFGCLAFFVSSRYRMEVVPSLAVLAAVGLVTLVQRRQAWRRRVPWLVLGLVLFVVASRPVGMPGRSQASISHLQMGDAYERSGRPVEAEAAYERAIELLPENAFAWRNLLQIRVRSEGPAIALEELEAAPETARDNPELLNLRGRFLAALGRGEEGLAELERATREQPLHRDAWYHLARVRQELGLYDEAVAAYERTLELNYRPADVSSALSFLYLQTARPESAREAALRALELRPGDGEAEMNLFIARIFLGRLDEARAQRPTLTGGGPLLDYYTGLLALREGRLEAAVEALNAAWTANSANSRAAYYLELSARAAGRRIDAWSDFGESPQLLEDWFRARATEPWAGIPSEAPLLGLWNRLVDESGKGGPAAAIVRFVREEETGYSRHRP